MVTLVLDFLIIQKNLGTLIKIIHGKIITIFFMFKHYYLFYFIQFNFIHFNFIIWK